MISEIVRCEEKFSFHFFFPMDHLDIMARVDALWVMAKQLAFDNLELNWIHWHHEQIPPESRNKTILE